LDDAEIFAAATDTGGGADAEGSGAAVKRIMEDWGTEVVVEVSGAAVKRIIVEGGTEVVAIKVALFLEVGDDDDTVEEVGCP